MNSCLRSLILLVACLLALALASPIHSIWANLPQHEEKRSYYGAFQHVPGYAEDDRDKKNMMWFDRANLANY
ncbi:unnamed protein product, partial [Mesorhabditis spiculigera]